MVNKAHRRKENQVRDAMQAAGITFRPLAVETLGVWTERTGSWQGTKRSVDKALPLVCGRCVGAMPRSPGLRSLYSGCVQCIDLSSACCLAAEHHTSPALCGEMGPVLPSHTALSSTLAAPHDIMLHTTGLYSAVTGHHSLASTLSRGRTQYPES